MAHQTLREWFWIWYYVLRPFKPYQINNYPSIGSIYHIHQMPQVWLVKFDAEPYQKLSQSPYKGHQLVIDFQESLAIDVGIIINW